MRILFVDDDPQVLDGLRDLLRRRRHGWAMSFALGSDAALRELAAAAFDVVVSDVRMPGLDGASLLELVRDRQPQAARIVLSGQMEADAAVRTAGVAHRFLAKPCDYDDLLAAIESRDRRALLGDAEVRALVTAASVLPSAPAVFAELAALVGDDDASPGAVAALVERDIGMTAKVLQLVNSSFFALGRSIGDVQEAVTYLGMETVKALVLSAEVFRALDPGTAGPLRLEELEGHASRVARSATRLAGGRCEAAESAAAAAFLHDVGKLVLAVAAPDRLERALAAAREGARPLHAVERELFGWTHADVGASLLGLWNLPDPLVDAVAFHHAPAEQGGDGLSLAGVVHIADALACELDGRPALLDGAYVTRLGLDAAVDAERQTLRRR